MTLKYFLCFIFLCLFINSAFSQSLFSGTVSDIDSKKALPDIICRITDTSGKKSWGFGFTDKDGRYSISIKSNTDTILLIISTMGYETQKHILTNTTQNKDIYLKEKPYELKEVTVAPPVIWKVGDTITYNVEKLKTDNDRYIVDVLKKLPGIEVSATGSISYLGTTINKFYIEGLDLLGHRYNIASNNIPSDAIERVQIFENHQPVKALQDVSPSDKAALNLKLKNSYKMKPIINAEVGTGFSADDWLNFINISGMQIRKNRQSLLTVKANNTGTGLSGDLHEHSILEIYDLNMHKTLLRPGISVPYNIEKASLFNESYIFTLNELFRLTDDSQLKINASYLNENEWRNYEIHNSYYIGEDDSWTIDEIGRLNNHHNKGDLSISFNTNKSKSYIDNTLKLSGSWGTASSIISGTHPNSQRFYMPSFTLENKLNIIKHIDKNVYNFSSNASYNNQPQFLNIKPDSSYMENIGLLKQNTSNKNLNTATNLSLSRRIRRSTFSLSTTLKTEGNTLKSDMETSALFPYNNKNYLTHNKYDLTLSPGFNRTIGLFKTEITLPISFISLHNKNKDTDNTKKSKSYLFVGSQFRISYDINVFWNTSYIFDQKKQTGDMLDFADGLRFLNYQTLYYGSGLYEVRQSQSHSVRAAYKNPVEALFFNFIAIYRPSKSNLFNGYTFSESNRISFKDEDDNKRDNYIFTSSIAKFVDPLKTNIRITGGYNINKFNQYQQGLSHRVTNNLYNIGSKIDSKLGEKYSASLNVECIGSKIKTKTYNSDYNMQWKVNGGWHFFPVKTMQLSLYCDYNINEIHDNLYADIFLMNANIKYKKPRWELSIYGHNLLNKKEYELISFDGLNTFSSKYHLRQREVLASIKFLL